LLSVIRLPLPAWSKPPSWPPDFETQREPVPRIDSGELDTALAFLAFVRSCLLKRAAGLTEEQPRRVVVPSGTSILGLIQHLTVGERFWFQYQFAGIGEGADFDFDMVVPLERSGAEVIEGYRAAIEESNELIRRIGDPAARHGVDRRRISQPALGDRARHW
jgi:Protein of unknown function (DUF664)